MSLSSGSKVAVFLPPGVLQLMIVNRAVTSAAIKLAKLLAALARTVLISNYFHNELNKITS